MTLPESLTKPTPPRAIDPVPSTFHLHTIPTVPITPCTTYHVHDRNLACLAEYIKQVSKSTAIGSSDSPCVLYPDDIGIIFVIFRDVIENLSDSLADRVFRPLFDLLSRPLFVGLTQLQSLPQSRHVDYHFIVIGSPLLD